MLAAWINSLPLMVLSELSEIATRCASRSAAILYGKSPGFRLISALTGSSLRLYPVYGVLTWRAMWNARHVPNRGSMLHAINRVSIRGVEMACNAPSSALERTWCQLHALPDGREQHGVQCATV